VPTDEIRYFQAADKPLIPRAAMKYLIRESLFEISQQHSQSQLPHPHQQQQKPGELSLRALSALQECLEAEMVKLLENAMLAAIHSRRRTLLPVRDSICNSLRHFHTYLFILFVCWRVDDACHKYNE
jgi:histone H3/H4